MTHFRSVSSRCLAFFVASALSLASASVAGGASLGEKGAVATVNPLATDAALEVMSKGGNAVDVAVAAGFALGVVDGFNSGIGGGCFMVIHLADGRVVAIDGRETAPAAATRDMYLRDGKADVKLSQTGPLAVGVPGAVAAYCHAATNFGKLPLRVTLAPAIKIARDGFEVTETFTRRANEVAKDLAQFPGAKMIFLRDDGSPKQPGDWLRQTALAETCQAIADQGPEAFYQLYTGPKIAGWMKANGGLLTAEDFGSYRIKLREPVEATYRGHRIVGFPPPSSGGVHVAQILNILENFDLKKMGAGSPDFIHVVAEAMKLAFADRAFWLGDPDFAKVPRGLVSKDYAKQLAKKIRRDRATPVPSHNTPPGAETDLFSKHTTHFSTADAEGNWVACTATVNTTFGSKIVVPGTGVVLNNEMDDFSAQPGVANYFGLVGNEANAVAPGKRPLSSMSPTIVFKDGKPVLAVGAAGGPTIISQTLLTIIHTIDFGLDPEAALKQPRFHQQWSPDELRIEKAVSEEVRKELERRGHKLKVLNSFGACQAIGRASEGGFTGAADPRLKGKAAGL
jgi:gamma-glutamyltranspeptidase/glutathione hydrolase